MYKIIDENGEILLSRLRILAKTFQVCELIDE